MSAETPTQKELPGNGDSEGKETYLPPDEAYERIQKILELLPPEERFGLVSGAIQDLYSELGETDLLMLLDGLLQNFSSEEQEQIIERTIYKVQSGIYSLDAKGKDPKRVSHVTPPAERLEVAKAIGIYKFKLEQWYQRGKEKMEAGFDQETSEILRMYFRKRLEQEYQDGLNEIDLKVCDLELKINPNNRDLIYEKAALLEQMRLYEKAVNTYKILLLDESNNPILWSHIAKNLDRMGNLRQALIACNESVRLDPENRQYLIDKANLCYRMKAYEEALRAYKRVVELDPSDINVRISYLNILEKLGLYEQALEGYQGILTVQPNTPYTLCRLGDTLVRLNRKEEALQAYECASDLHNNIHVRLRKAILLEELLRHEDALRIYEEILTLFPENSELRLCKERLLRKLEDHKKLSASISQGIETEVK